MKVKLFTHNDLDGVGCAIVAFYAFGSENVDVEYCSYDDIDEKVKNHFTTKEFLKYDRVFITDISVNNEVAELIEIAFGEDLQWKGYFHLIDHHPTANWLNQYPWAFVNTDEPCLDCNNVTMKSSGTSLLYNYLFDDKSSRLKLISNFIEKVRRYDTWEWNTKYSDEHAKQLNDLLFIIGRDKFIQRFIDNYSVQFSDTENLILEIEQNKINDYIQTKSEQMFISRIREYEVGVVYAESYTSQLGNVLAKNNPHLDFIIIIDVGNCKVSYRGIHDNIHLGDVASYYGGGGHAKAAGSQFSPLLKEDLWIEFI